MVDTTSNIPLIGGNPSQVGGIDWMAISQFAKNQAQQTTQSPHSNPVSGIGKKIGNELLKSGSELSNGLDSWGLTNLGIGSTVGSGVAGAAGGLSGAANG